MAVDDALSLGARHAQSRVMFGPIVTNLGDDERRFTDAHRAFYARRAAGGCGVIVAEGASVHDSDWPYERAPLAGRAAPGWAAISDACHEHGALLIASLDHAGGQGASAYSQLPLWAPSGVPEVNTREVPKVMEDDDIAAVIAGFAAAARLAVDAGCDGVELNAGQHSLIRQFLSGLTNQRGDQWGQDRARFAREVITAVAGAVRPAGVVLGLRLCADELAPWAGITPEQAPGLAAELAGCGIDYLVVVRGSIFSASATRPDFHEPTATTVPVARAIKAHLVEAGHGAVAVFAQGSIVDVSTAEAALVASTDGGPALDGVEMTRALLADPDLVVKARQQRVEDIRPCTRCNQTCQVRDARNPRITCVGEPTTGHELDDPAWEEPTRHPRDVVIVGGGVAGLETARVAARRGHRVEVLERAAQPGGMAAIAGPHRPLVEWLTRAARQEGATIRTTVTADEPPAGAVVVQCTGSIAGVLPGQILDGAQVVDAAALAEHPDRLPESGDIAVFDPIGGPIGVAVAELLGPRALLITQDHIAGNELSRSGDLAPANVRLAQRGVRILRRALLREVRRDSIVVEDRFSGERSTHPVAAVVDAGFRLPSPPVPGAHLRAGDAVAPRTVHEAILEGRRAALAIDGVET